MKPFPALCKDCKYSRPEEKINSFYNVCVQQKVVSRCSWALANNFEGRPHGVSCREERDKRSIFAPCGMKGKLWEPKCK